MGSFPSSSAINHKEGPEFIRAFLFSEDPNRVLQDLSEEIQETKNTSAASASLID